MPSLNVSFSDEELSGIRGAATDVSLKVYVHDAALKSARSRKDLVAQLARRVAEKSAELNARLP